MGMTRSHRTQAHAVGAGVAAIFEKGNLPLEASAHLQNQIRSTRLLRCAVWREQCLTFIKVTFSTGFLMLHGSPFLLQEELLQQSHTPQWPPSGSALGDNAFPAAHDLRV